MRDCVEEDHCDTAGLSKNGTKWVFAASNALRLFSDCKMTSAETVGFEVQKSMKKSYEASSVEA